MMEGGESDLGNYRYPVLYTANTRRYAQISPCLLYLTPSLSKLQPARQPPRSRLHLINADLAGIGANWRLAAGRQVPDSPMPQHADRIASNRKLLQIQLCPNLLPSASSFAATGTRSPGRTEIGNRAGRETDKGGEIGQDWRREKGKRSKGRCVSCDGPR